MKGVIYRITCNVTGECYYGSTIDPIRKRILGHKADYNRARAGRKRSYYSSYPIIERDNYCYEVLEELEIEDKKDLLKRERYYIENNPCINKEIPSRTKAEYNKTYREQNREKINERRRFVYKLKKENEKLQNNNIDIL